MCMPFSFLKGRAEVSLKMFEDKQISFSTTWSLGYEVEFFTSVILDACLVCLWHWICSDGHQFQRNTFFFNSHFGASCSRLHSLAFDWQGQYILGEAMSGETLKVHVKNLVLSFAIWFPSSRSAMLCQMIEVWRKKLSVPLADKFDLVFNFRFPLLRLESYRNCHEGYRGR